MTHAINTNQTIESQTVPFQEGPIKTIPADIVGSILYFANNSESTRLVNQDWNERTFAVVAYKNQELERTIPLIIKKLDPATQAQCIAELTDLQRALSPLVFNQLTFREARFSFLDNKAELVIILRKLPENERDQLQNAIGEELPNSLKDVFEISTLNIRTVGNINVDTFFTLLQSYQPLSRDDRGWAVANAANFDNMEFVKLLLASGPISMEDRGWAIQIAAYRNNLELVKLLLANGPILERSRGFIVLRAVSDNNLELVKVLLAGGPIPHEDRRAAIWVATVNMNLELVHVLTDMWIIAELCVGAALIGGLAWFGYKINEMQASIADSQARLDDILARLAESRARLEESLVRLAESQARLAARF
jgi:hypothetical protein